jgi:hypothetical protein
VLSVYPSKHPELTSHLYLHIQHKQRREQLISEQLIYESRNRPGVAQRVPGDLGSQIFMTFGTSRWLGRHPHALAAFTPRNVSGTHFH